MSELLFQHLTLWHFFDLIPFLVLHLVPHCIDDMVLIDVDDLLELIPHLRTLV